MLEILNFMATMIDESDQSLFLLFFAGDSIDVFRRLRHVLSFSNENGNKNCSFLPSMGF